MQSYPFISKITTEYPYGDRAIDDALERRFNKLQNTNGVYLTSSASSSLQVMVNTGMTVNVNPGGCIIEGARGFEDSTRTFTLSAAHASLKRIDRIVVRMDTSDAYRNTEIYLKEGSPSSTPVAPDIIRQSNYYEIVLADILVRANTTEVTQADITDQRLNSDLCGMVVPAFPQPLSLDDIHAQISGFMTEYMEIVQSALDQTTAGLLQGEIDTTNNNVAALKAEKLIITKTNVAVRASSAVYDSTFSDYPYRVDIAVDGCTEAHRPEIDLSPDDTSDIVYDLCKTSSGKVSVWLKNNTFGSITILSLTLTAQRGA